MPLIDLKEALLQSRDVASESGWGVVGRGRDILQEALEEQKRQALDELQTYCYIHKITNIPTHFPQVPVGISAPMYVVFRKGKE